MVVFYRGWHCPVCRGYLAQLDRRIEELDHLGVSVVAVSGDSEDRAKRSIGEWGLNRLPPGRTISRPPPAVSPRPGMRDCGTRCNRPAG
jgi:hypothetical protein